MQKPTTELYRQESNNTSLHVLITSWVTYALRRLDMCFCYNFYRKWSYSGKISFQVTGCSSRNRSTVCHSTSNVCVVGTSAWLSNNRKDQWWSFIVHITIGRCHTFNGIKINKTCGTEVLRASSSSSENFLSSAETTNSSPSQRPLPPRWRKITSEDRSYLSLLGPRLPSSSFTSTSKSGKGLAGTTFIWLGTFFKAKAAFTVSRERASKAKRQIAFKRIYVLSFINLIPLQQIE